MSRVVSYTGADSALIGLGICLQNVRVSSSLDFEQARLLVLVGPDLGPNCLQRLRAKHFVATGGWINIS